MKISDDMIQRTQEQNVRPWLDKGKAVIIIGPRAGG